MAGHSSIHLSYLATQRSTNRRMVVRTGPGIKQDPISKITNTKRGGRGG
jgi:hypothetical protein